MAQATHAGTFTHERIGVFAGSPAHQACRILQLGFVVGRLSHQFDRGAVTTSAARM
jgi:hypothetical protein